MSEEQTKKWMQELAGGSLSESVPDPRRIWLLAQLDASFEPQRKARATLVRLDAAVSSGFGLALAGLSLWLIGIVAR